jgi:predicted metal-dependent hydrolase
MLHELAHTQVMDHSSRFWTALERLDSDAHSNREQMKDAARLVPPWADV